MPWISGAIVGGLGLLGSSMTSSSNQSAANTSADAQLRSAQLAADAAKFRPVGVTNRFGGSRFTTDGAGNVTGASYDVAPDVARLRDWLMNQAGVQGLSSAQQAGEQGQGLFNLARGYMAQTPEQAAADWMTKQQALLAPSRDMKMAKLMETLNNTGTTGLSVAQGGNLGNANPLAQALMNANALEDLEMATRAQEQGRAATTFGAGLFDQGLKTQAAGISPLTTMLGGASSIEDLARANLTTGAELGGRSAQAGANVGQALLQGGIGAAKTIQGASASPWGSTLTGMANNPAFISGISEWFKTPQPNYSTVGYSGPDRGMWF